MRLPSLSGGVLTVCLLSLAAACGGSDDDDDDAVITCTSNADCIAENPCTIGRCGINNVCAFEIGPDGAAANEKDGDCRRATCRNGQPTFTNDNSDVMDDEDPCTDDRCENGMPTNLVSEDGSSCEVGSGSGICQQGTCIVLCVEANAASQCDDDDPCTDDVCVPCDNPDDCFNQGQCAHEPGNGPGPDDGQDCTTDLCEDGEPVHEPAPAGTACTSGGNVCNAAGDCVGCANDDDCAGFEVRNCYIAVCNSGECEEEVAPKGTIPDAADTVGDCKRPICSGTGSMTTEDDDEDVPADEPCVVESCVEGNPMYEASAPGDACDGDGVCSDYAECCAPFVHDGATDVVALRRAYTDYFSFTSYLATFDTATGASVDIATLGVSPEQVIHDPISGQVYYLTYNGLGLFADCGDAALEGITLPTPDTTNPLNGASALAWDTSTEQILVASQNNGVLYSYDPAGTWSELGNLSFYPTAGSYFSGTDKLYLTDSSWATSMAQFTPAGVLEDTVSLSPALTNSWYTTHVQIREAGNLLYYIMYGYDLSLGHQYLFTSVDPATGDTSEIASYPP
ncbi:MAG TPA: hypothetical protein VM686_42485 [Polyangiaceae bacterium]|nr:hypothetical protein [Polyangiaceae bacterium]